MRTTVTLTLALALALTGSGRADSISSMVDNGCKRGWPPDDQAECPPRALPEEDEPVLESGPPGDETGSFSIVVGTGEGPIPIVAGPIRLSAVVSNCFVTTWLLYDDGSEAEVSGSTVFVPANAVFAVRDGGGFCQGTITYSGWRPE